MKVHHGEGVASHIGPEPCVVVREGKGEASVGERIGQPLSRERELTPDADAVLFAEGNMCGTAMRGADALPGSKATSRAKGSHRKLGGLVSGRQMLRERHGPHREGEEP